MRLDTIKNPFRIQLPLQWFYPSPLPRESLLYFFQIFKELHKTLLAKANIKAH
jgi:hypothetical protein